MYIVSQDEVTDEAIYARKESDAQLVHSGTSINYELHSKHHVMEIKGAGHCSRYQKDNVKE